MMGNSSTNEKGKACASADSGFSRGKSPPSGLAFLEENVDEDTFDSILGMSLTFADLEDFHQSVAQGIPETVANPRGYLTNSNSFQNPQINTSSNSGNANLQGVSLLPDCNMSWGQESNQGHNAISTGGISTFGGESSFASFNRPQVNRDIAGSSFLLCPRESAPVHTRNNVGFNLSQSGSQGNYEGGFLSLRLGGTEESVSGSQLGSRGIFDKLKEAASNGLKMARVPEARSQTLDQTLDDDFMGFQSNRMTSTNNEVGFHENRMTSTNNEVGFHENRMTSTNNDVGFYGTLDSWPGSNLQQNDMQHDKNTSLGDLHHFRDEKVKKAVSTSLKMVHARKATSQSSGQSLDAGLMSFQSNTSRLSNRFSNMDGMNLTNNEVGVHGTLNRGLGTNSNHILQMQQNNSRNIRSGDMNHYRAFIGNQPVHSGTIGGSSAQKFNSQQHNLIKPSEFEKPLRLASYLRSTTANNPNYAGQVISQNVTPSQVLGVGSNMFPQRTAVPQVSWVESSLAGIDEPFPKRLGMEFNVKNSHRFNQRHLSPMGASFQTTSTGQVCQFPEKGLTRLTDHVLGPSVGRTDGAPVSYPINSLEPFRAHGQSLKVPIQLAKDPQGAPSANASNVTGQSQTQDLHIRPHRKRSAVGPHPASRWVQRQKLIHPTVHHSMPNPYIHLTNQMAQVHPNQMGQVHPFVPVGSRAQPADPVAARIRPVVPCASIVRPRVPVANSPAVSHIASKDPEATPKLSGYKCFLCKRDLALTSEGPVYQPAAPPPVAILPCGHSFHDQCLQNITPDDQPKDPPCIPCAIGEQ